MFIRVLQIIAAAGTAVKGLVALIMPATIKGFTGLSAEGGRGITEIRSAIGGFFLALGLAPLFLRDPVAYRMLGITYLVVAVVRFVSMFVDKSVESSNIISLVVEIIFGVILIL